MYRSPGAKALRRSATAEHVLAGKPTLLIGRTLANYRIWDVMRALDYLESRPDVNGERMGMLGHSGGGMITLLTAPLEPRLRAVMSCCAVTSFYHKTKAMLNPDPEQVVPGIYAHGVDHPELLAAVAPRAFLIGAVLRDFVPLEGTQRTYDEARPLFAIAGAEDHLGKIESDDVHSLDRTLREGCYAWMSKYLADESKHEPEPEIEIEMEADLRCTPTGFVMDLDDARSVFDLNRECAHHLRIERANQRGAHLKDVETLLAIKQVSARRQGRFLITEPGIELPFTLSPGKTRRGELIILVAEQGRQSLFAQEMAESLSHAGPATLAVDLRGWGELEPTTPGKKVNFVWEDFFAFRSFEMGRPLLGMRVNDLLSIVQLMAMDYHRVFMVGLEGGGLITIHAAALEPTIAGAATCRTLVSYEDVMERQRYTETVGGFVPAALPHYDLPELLQSIAPRPHLLLDPYNRSRKPVTGEPLEAADASAAILRAFGLS